MDNFVIQRDWPLEEIIRISQFDRGVINLSYRVDTVDGRYVLRVLPEGRSQADVDFEASVLGCCKDLGVPQFIERDGSFLFTFGDRHGVIYRFLEGSHVESLTVDHVRSVGNWLGRFHVAVEHCENVVERKGLYDFSDERLAKMQSQIQNSGIPDKERMEELVKIVATSVFDDTLPRGPIHLDVKPDNVLFNSDGVVSGVLDFDNSCIGYDIFDVVKSGIWFSIDEGRFDVERFKALLQAYNSQRPLLGIEQTVIYDMVMFAFASHLFVDMYHYAIGVIPESYYTFLMTDFYHAFQDVQLQKNAVKNLLL